MTRSKFSSAIRKGETVQESLLPIPFSSPLVTPTLEPSSSAMELGEVNASPAESTTSLPVSKSPPPPAHDDYFSQNSSGESWDHSQFAATPYLTSEPSQNGKVLLPADPSTIFRGAGILHRSSHQGLALMTPAELKAVMGKILLKESELRTESLHNDSKPRIPGVKSETAEHVIKEEDDLPRQGKEIHGFSDQDSPSPVLKIVFGPPRPMPVAVKEFPSLTAADTAGKRTLSTSERTLASTSSHGMGYISLSTPSSPTIVENRESSRPPSSTERPIFTSTPSLAPTSKETAFLSEAEEDKQEEEQAKEKLGWIPADVQNRRLEMFKIAGGSSNTVILINPSSLSKKLDDVILKLDGRKLIKTSDSPNFQVASLSRRLHSTQKVAHKVLRGKTKISPPRPLS